MASTSQNLAAQSIELKESVSYFKIDDSNDNKKPSQRTQTQRPSAAKNTATASNTRKPATADNKPKPAALNALNPGKDRITLPKQQAAKPVARPASKTGDTKRPSVYVNKPNNTNNGFNINLRNDERDKEFESF